MKLTHLAWIASAILLTAGLLITLDFAGIILAFSELLPSADENTTSYNVDLIKLAGRELIWISLSGFLCVLLIGSETFPTLISRIEQIISTQPQRTLTITLTLCAVIAWVTATSVLNQFPNSADEYAYIFQAADFSQGKLWSDVHQHPEFFEFDHIVQKENKWISRFPPGWPLILSLAYILVLPPFLINIACSVAAMYFFYQLVKHVYGERIAPWSTFAVVTSSFFLFNAASYFSHVSSFLHLVCAMYFTILYFKDGKFWRVLLAGFFVGMLAITRPYTAVLLLGPFYTWLIWIYRRKSLKPIIAVAIGALPCIAFYLWYNGLTTGDILLPVTVWAYPEEKLGFYGDHTLALGIKHIVKRLLMFIYWVSPHLLLLYILLLINPRDTVRKRSEDFFFAILVIGYILYYSYGGNQYGPRFYFEAFPFLVVFVAVRAMNNTGWIRVLFITGIIYALVRIPVISIRENHVVRERMDIYDQVAEKNIREAIVFIASPTGVIRPMDAENLNRNDKQYRNDVLYALDLGERNQILMDQYPDRRFFRYERDPEKMHGTLVEITPGNLDYVRR